MMKTSSYVLVDAHVHIQDCFSLPKFLHYAYNNFKKEAGRLKLSGDFSAVLLLSEAASIHYFSTLREVCADGTSIQDNLFGAWSLIKTGESCSIEARGDKGESLTIIAGRQIVTQEKIEALALMTEAEFIDGEPLTQTIENIKAAGAVPIIPWGVGKWLGSRGKLLEEFIGSGYAEGVFLGDNGGRPTLWNMPTHFKQADSIGMLILPGSDALPLASEVERTGSFGFYMTKNISNHQPAAELKQCLLDKHASVKTFGKLRSPLSFVKDQILIRLK